MLVVPPTVKFATVALLVYVVVPLYLGVLLGGVSGLLTVATGLLTALFLYGDAPTRAYTDLPGPPRKWLVGNLADFVKTGGYIEFYGRVTQQYGLVAAVQLGVWPQILVADPVLIKQVCLENFDSFRDRKGLLTLRKNKGLLLTKGDHWQRSRKALNPAFNSIKLAAFADTISRHCEALVARLDRIIAKNDEGNNDTEDNPKSKPIDVTRLFGDLTMDVIASTSFDSEFGLQELEIDDNDGADENVNKQSNIKFGASDKRQKDLMQSAKRLFQNSGGPLGSGGALQMFVTVVMPFLGPLFKILWSWLQTPEGKEVTRAITTLDSTMTEILEGRSRYSISQKDTASDNAAAVDANFIDLIRKARDPDSGIGLDFDEVRDQLNLFVLAGYETTNNTLSYIAFLLAQHPEVEERLVQEIQRLAPNKEQRLSFKDLAEFTYASNVINEALRLYPPAPMLSRVADRDITLKSGDGQAVQIKKGGWIVVPIYSLHRDKRFWENPEKFDPDRFLPERCASRPKYVHLPFGLGPRNCIGQRFALEEIKLALVAMYREHTFQLHESTKLPLKLRAGITMSPADGIWMTVHKREEKALQLQQRQGKE